MNNLVVDSNMTYTGFKSVELELELLPPKPA